MFISVRVAFVIQDEVAAVKELMHSSTSAEEKCPLLYKKYTQLVQDHKLQERKMAEALRKQLEVKQILNQAYAHTLTFLMCVSAPHPSPRKGLFCI